MKRRILSIILSAALLLSTFAAVAGLGVYAQSDSAEFTKSSLDFVSEINVGINIGNTYDVAECWNGPTGWGNPDITENLIKSIKARGFNAIRLPVTWYGGANVGVAPDYTISTTWMNRVKTIVDLIMDNDMYLIINMHHENAWLGTLTDIETDENKTLFQTHLDQYIAGWTQIAETFKDYGEKLIFEAHNEVRYGDSWAAYWEGYQQIRIYNQTFVDTVRATGSNNAKRYLIFKCFAGGFMGETEFYYDEENGLEPTYNPIPNDPANHLILSYHAYAPGTFCMTQANQNASSNVTTFDEECFVNSLEDTAKKAQEMYMSRGIGVIVGEMGSVNKNNKAARLKHAELFVETMGKYGIKCIWWDNGSTRVNNGGSDSAETFGLVNRSNPSQWPHGDIADVLVNTGNKYLGVKYNYTYYIAGSIFSKYAELHYSKSESWMDDKSDLGDLSPYIKVDPKGTFTLNIPSSVGMCSQQVYAWYNVNGTENSRATKAIEEAKAGTGYLMFDVTVNEAKDKDGNDATVGFKYNCLAGQSLTNDQIVTLPTGTTVRFLVDVTGFDTANLKDGGSDWHYQMYFKNVNWGDALSVLNVTMTPITVAIPVETINDYAYQTLDDSKISIVKYLGNSDIVEIPSTIDGKSVTSIADRAFEDCTNLTSVTIPDSVTSIGNSAFSGCTKLESITIPDSITSIGTNVFSGCTGLTSITIPDSVTSIGDSAFNDCTSLTTVTIPDSVIIIGGSAFSGCTSLTSVEIPDSITSIGSNVFSGCTGLISISIADSVTSIGQYVFSGCTSLTTVTIPDSVTSIESTAFSGCPIKNLIIADGSTTVTTTMVLSNDIESVTIPKSVVSIPNYAFRNCTSLTKANIADGVTSIGKKVFYGCSSLTSIEIPDSVTSIGEDAFNEATTIICGCNSAAFQYAKDNQLNYHVTHSFEHHDEVAAQCESTGMKEYYSCKICDLVFDKDKAETTLDELIIPATGHTEEIILGKSATCTETGLTEGKKCSVCGEILVAQEVIPANGHTEEIIPGNAATCTETGLTEGKKCSVCGEILVAQEVIPAKGHTEEIISGKAATCTETGLTDGKKCSVCGEILVAQEIIPAKGHTEEIIPGKAATCTDDGCTYGIKCHDCGVILVEQQIVKAKGHTEQIIPGKAATCTETGLTEGKMCLVCGEIIVAQEVIPAKDHTEEIISGKAATCTETGLTEGKKCSVCGDILVAQEIIPANGHTEKIIPGKAATCTESGLTEGKKCSVCGEILVAQEVIPAKRHTYVLVDEVPATYDKDGVKAHYICSDCNKLFDLGKNEVTSAEIVIPKLEMTVTYGDANGDGKINLLDLISMRKYLAKWNVDADLSAIDCNADGKINLLDLIILRKYLAKWDVVLGPQK